MYIFVSSNPETTKQSGHSPRKLMMSNQGQSRLLRLPLELQDLIYGYLNPIPSEVHLKRRGGPGAHLFRVRRCRYEPPRPLPNSDNPPPALHLVCKMMYVCASLT